MSSKSTTGSTGNSMLASSPLTSSTSNTARSPRSLLQKLTTSLKNPHARNVADFHIEPLEPHRQYAPGDWVQGAVVLTVLKPVRVTHMTVCLHGLVRVYKSAAGVSDGPIATASKSRQTRYLGDGQAVLFQDETTLCGEGRLEPGVYRFNFELEFPGRGLPTSIDFERGTIAYMLTATLTRPTSIAATMTCDTKLTLVETVDVGPLAPPKPRTISLEPVSKYSKQARKTATGPDASGQTSLEAEKRSTAAQSNQSSPIPHDDAESSTGSRDDQSHSQNSVGSDARSSRRSISSSSNQVSFRGATANLSKVTSASKSQAASGKTSGSKKTITTRIELSRSGCLPGDNVIVRLSIAHAKVVKSMRGIIVTLYRQGQIDASPSPNQTSKAEQGQKQQHNKCYPKSKAGFGGLSLSSTGSSSTFRKDLSQTFAPLIVDPNTLTADISTSIRVPEDVFPTIDSVPGAMISFKYFIEVIVDLGGRIAGQQRHLSKLAALPGAAAYSTRADTVGAFTASQGITVDTDHIRREKNLIACAFEITVGTVDSTRTRSRHADPCRATSEKKPSPVSEPDRESHPEALAGFDSTSAASGGSQYLAALPECILGTWSGAAGTGTDEDAYTAPPVTIESVPPPHFTHNENLTDKERVRLAEERLLPSQPPGFTEPGPSSYHDAAQAPSAPPLVHFQSGESRSDLALQLVSPRPTLNREISSPVEHSSFDNISHNVHDTVSIPQSRTAHVSALHAVSSDIDKKELERQRLAVEASAPDGLHIEEDEEATGSRAALAPSAPMLSASDSYSNDWLHDNEETDSSPAPTNEALPRYER